MICVLTGCSFYLLRVQKMTGTADCVPTLLHTTATWNATDKIPDSGNAFKSQRINPLATDCHPGNTPACVAPEADHAGKTVTGG